LSLRIGNGTCNGTFGELVQGILYQQPFLITLPIPVLRSEAVFIPDATKDEIISQSSNMKAIKACKNMFQLYGLNGGGYLHLRSNIPRGKGMASSSADLVSAMRAVADSYFIRITDDIISQIVSEIEPTDGVMYEGVVAYDYINGQLIESFGSLPPFGIIGIDIGGVIDTIQFNQQLKQYDRCDRNTFLEAYNLIESGIRNKDLSLICRASTMSAHVNEKFLPKPFFKEIKKLTSICQGGIVVAHSGTMLGILFDPAITNLKEFSLHLSRFFYQTKTFPFYYTNTSS
jgi:L-threonine kinase